MVINGLGVLMTGHPNIGKSELTLALIDRDHQLVSDDAIDIFERQGELIGQSPTMLNDCLLIKGMGIINIKKIFGDNAVVLEHQLQLIIDLIEPEDMPSSMDPLQPLIQEEKIHTITIPKIIFPALTGRALALLIETLIKNYQLKLQGFDAGKEFNVRQHQLLKKNML